jgi:hypothetical protein
MTKKHEERNSKLSQIRLNKATSNKNYLPLLPRASLYNRFSIKTALDCSAFSASSYIRMWLYTFCTRHTRVYLQAICTSFWLHASRSRSRSRTIHDPYAKYVHICALCSYTTCTVLVHIICMYVQAPPTVDNLIYTTHSPFQQHTNKRSLPSIKHPTFSSPCLARGASCLAWK